MIMKELILLVFLTSLFFNACDKNNESSNKEYRIVSELNSGIYKFDYVYDNNQIVQLIRQIESNDEVWEEDYQVDFYYDNNRIFSIGSFITADGLMQDRKWSATFNEGRIVEEKVSYYISEEWVPDNKYSYVYDNDKLNTATKYYYNSGGEAYPYYRYECHYTDELLSEYYKVYYEDGQWVTDQKTECSYSGGHISQMIKYDSLNEELFPLTKNEYDHSNGKIAQINYFLREAGDWNLEGYDQYDYDAQGCLSEFSTTGQTIQYEYEEGEGNIEQFFYTPLGLLWPNPQVSKKQEEESFFINRLLKIAL